MMQARWRHFGGTCTIGVCLGLGVVAVAAPPKAPGASSKPETVGPQFYPSLDAAAAAAEADQSLVLVIFGAEWCGPCKALRQQSLFDPAFTKLGMVHAMYLDVDVQAKLAEQFQVRAIPDLVALSPQLQVVSRHSGFMTGQQLADWFEAARKRAAQGVWEGMDAGELPGAEATLTTDPAALVQMLGAAQSMQRTRAAGALLQLSDRAMPALINGLADPTLAVRISAAEVLARLAPQAPAYDPWADASSRLAARQAIEQWWKQTGTLPAIAMASLAPGEQRSIDEAVASVMAEEPVRRTEAMTLLVQLGPASLPSLRKAIATTSTKGDQRTLWALEDVRWAILVPSQLEQSTRVRRTLARGSSDERQTATEQLAAAGSVALPALRELIDDADPMVRESAARALTSIGGAESLEAIATLLSSSDSNLRMVAAKQLGESKSAAAGVHLAKVIADRDEMVACVAIAAVEQAKAMDAVDAVIAALGDPRWRVRAAAAEALGKLEVGRAGDALQKLLDDSDPFVVKSAVDALKKVSRNVDTATLTAMVERTPALTQVTVQLLLDHGRSGLTAIEAMYDSAVGARREEIVAALASYKGSNWNLDPHWKPLVQKILTSEDTNVRRQLATVLGTRSVELARDFLDPLLHDHDATVRTAAMHQVVRAVAHHYGAGSDPSYYYGRSSDERKSDFGILTRGAATAAAREASSGLSILSRIATAATGKNGDAPAATNDAPSAVTADAIREMHARWHATLTELRPTSPSPIADLAFYVTGDSKSNLDALLSAIDAPDAAKVFTIDRSGSAMPVVLLLLPWPEGRPAIEKIQASPQLSAMAFAAIQSAKAEARTYLANPAQIVATLESAKPDQVETLVEMLLGRGEDGTSLSLAIPGERRDQMIAALSQSTSPLARAVATYALGISAQKPAAEQLRAALADKDHRVRQAAIRAVLNLRWPDAQRGELLGPLLSDDDTAVAAAAATALLDDSILGTTGLGSDMEHFTFDSIQVWRHSDRFASDANRPIRVLTTKPAYLDAVRSRLAVKGANLDEDAQQRFALLLAQHGEFDALDAALAQWLKGPRQEAPPTLLTGLLLTKDPKYLPLLETLVKAADDRWDLQRTLTWLRGVPGDQARELRRQINQKMRDMPN